MVPFESYHGSIANDLPVHFLQFRLNACWRDKNVMCKQKCASVDEKYTSKQVYHLPVMSEKVSSYC